MQFECTECQRRHTIVSNLLLFSSIFSLNSPLLRRHIACRNENARICLYLLANGASLDLTNMSDEAPYDCIQNENGPCGRVIFFNLQIRSIAGFAEDDVICQ